MSIRRYSTDLTGQRCITATHPVNESMRDWGLTKDGAQMGGCYLCPEVGMADPMLMDPLRKYLPYVNARHKRFRASGQRLWRSGRASPPIRGRRLHP
jgi:hypothetical protein